MHIQNIINENNKFFNQVSIFQILSFTQQKKIDIIFLSYLELFFLKRKKCIDKFYLIITTCTLVCIYNINIQELIYTVLNYKNAILLIKLILRIINFY